MHFSLFFFLIIPTQPKSTLFPYTTLFRSLFKLSEFVTGISHPRAPHDAAQLPAKRFVPFPTTSLVLAAATTVARLVAAQPRRKDDLTHPVRSFLAQGETHRQPFRSPTRMLAPGPLTSSWASFSWTVDATAPAVEHSRRRPQPRRPRSEEHTS